MSTTLSMWLGILFVVLAVVAVVLQAWLWGPKYWDAVNKKTIAPRFWLHVHRAVGIAYAGIYLFMMWHMVPRLWEYQFELPARTVIHAVLGITIGVLLLTKISIIRFFRHFEEAMPWIGMGLLLCTVNLAMLSLPFAVRAHDFGGRTLEPANRERVRRVLATIEFDHEIDVAAMTTPAAFETGREVLVHKCIACHDLRTILMQPRTGRAWHDVVVRMAEKPTILGERITEKDIPYVTAYLVAITPELQQSTKRRAAAERARAEVAAEIDRDNAPVADAGVPPRDAAPSDAAVPSPAEPALVAEEMQRLLSVRCTECHDLDEIDEHGGDTAEGWAAIVRRMVVEEGAELSDDEATLVTRWLAQEHPPGAEPERPTKRRRGRRGAR